jgi:hypothetical protein
VASAFVYAPRERRAATAAGVAVGFAVLFAALIFWRTDRLLFLLGAG